MDIRDMKRRMEEKKLDPARMKSLTNLDRLFINEGKDYLYERYYRALQRMLGDTLANQVIPFVRDAMVEIVQQIVQEFAKQTPQQNSSETVQIIQQMIQQNNQQLENRIVARIIREFENRGVLSKLPKEPEEETR